MAALDAMRKAHQNEVQREVSRFKAEFVQQLQNGGQSYDAHKENEYALQTDKTALGFDFKLSPSVFFREELYEVRQEILSLSEKYSIKCVEAATMEEKYRITAQQLKHFQQHIQQLENRWVNSTVLGSALAMTIRIC